MMEHETAAMAVSLPDDVLHEILVRVKDEPTLFRCATTCKRWCHLVADPSFLRCCWPDQDHSSFLIGFFAWQHRHGEDFMETCFIPAPRSPQGPGLRALGSFLTAAPAAGLFDRAVPLASRHGLLLVRLQNHDAQGHPDNKIFQLAVCRLLTGTCHMLPPIKLVSPIANFVEYKFCAYAVLTGADRHSNDESSPPPVLPSDSSFFKVVIITSDSYGDLKYSLHMFSSDQRRWSARTNCFNNTSDNYEHYGLFGDVVVCRGMAHWLFRYCGERYFYIISLNTQTNQISKRKLQFQKDYFLTSHISLTLGANGTLSVPWMKNKSKQLEIWGQQEHEKNVGGTYSEWLCTRLIEKKELGEETQGRNLCVFGEKCGKLLVNDGQQMYTADIETGRMLEVLSWPSKPIFSPKNVMPVDMDWPSIFMSRLHGTF